MARWVDLDKYNTMYCPKGMTKGSEQCNQYNNCDDCYVDYFKNDIAPVVHAEWKDPTETVYDVGYDIEIRECSNCGNELAMQIDDDKINYCPYCGAKMSE